MGIERIIDPKERERAHAEVGYVDFYSEAVKQSEEFRVTMRSRSTGPATSRFDY